MNFFEGLFLPWKVFFQSIHVGIGAIIFLSFILIGNLLMVLGGVASLISEQEENNEIQANSKKDESS